MINVKNIECKHPFYSNPKKIHRICQPLFQAVPISYFTYEKYYYDGSCIFLPHLPELDYEVLQVGHLPTARELSRNAAHYMLLSNEASTPVAWTQRKKALKTKLNIANQFGIHHILVLLFNHKKYTEMFFFGVEKKIKNYLDLFIFNMTLLEKFCIHFRSASTNILTKLERNRVKYDERLDNILMPNEIPNFFEAQTSLNLNTLGLSKRQNECLYYLTKGMSIKQIAQRLNLSARTVEHYLDTVKVKLGCTNRVDLINKMLSLEQGLFIST